MPPHAMTRKEYREMLESLGVSPEVIKATIASQEHLIGDAITVATDDLKDRLVIIESSKPEPKVSTMNTFPKPHDVNCDHVSVVQLSTIEKLFDTEFPKLNAMLDADGLRTAMRVWVAAETHNAGWTSYDVHKDHIVFRYTAPVVMEVPKAESETPIAPKSRFTFKRVLAGVVATAAVVTTVVVVVNKLRG